MILAAGLLSQAKVVRRGDTQSRKASCYFLFFRINEIKSQIMTAWEFQKLNRDLSHKGESLIEYNQTRVMGDWKARLKDEHA